MSSIIGADLVLLDTDAGADRQAVIARLAGLLAGAGRATDADDLTTAALAREAQSATGLPGGIAIPHCRSAAVREPSIGFARLSPAVDFGAPDGPADLVFLIAAPEGAGSAHMALLSSLARHEHRSVVEAYGHVNLGFTSKELRKFAEKAGLSIANCDTVTRERRPPHFEVISLTGVKP